MHNSAKSNTKSVAGSGKGSVEEAVGTHEPTQEEIQLRAYEIHVERRPGETGRILIIGSGPS